ncbi:MAG: bifunctional 3,4-dihydroxy-2-butanone-4-phosphate synthase/GTP cyclohydrolase II [Chlamydiae bacterium]|nr:bifunctional 3,4-dihydroxy-2-butanone-4-phosphate synthase/GTP cyclohydrolase II [Chlamydiota bacterium]MBI3267150.1 bifunctional 3,4-dihydroxy-2-butanone-4-phosphate synthase/GTP cyclohydrolase II [Chlamydiota bacterium]
MEFDPIEKAIADIRQGKLIIMTDDEDRENEGDLIFAAQHATPQAINFMAKHGRGLICVPMMGKHLDSLGLRPMVDESRDAFETDFSISVDARLGVTTGISAVDRARTIQVLTDLQSVQSDLVSPGHIFPLRAKEGGVLTRAGHTEAAVDLARLAGLTAAGVICEIMNDDGSMARCEDLVEFKKRHGLSLCNIAQLIEYRRRNEKLVEQVVKTHLPTEYGDFDVFVYRSLIDEKNHLAILCGEIESHVPTLVRVHSECITGDVFSSSRCDCGEQLHRSLSAIAKEGRGILVYMRQEGRGIGLLNKLKAYKLQDNGLDTVEANKSLGLPADLREYGTGAQILFDLGVRKIRLLTNNPKKVVGLDGFGLEIVERVPIPPTLNEHNRNYLKAKQDKLGHLFNLTDLPVAEN